MADKKYKLIFELGDGSTREVRFDAPQGPRGESGVYVLADGEMVADAPADADVVIDPRGIAAGECSGGAMQADWNAVEGESGFILNKPFGVEIGEVLPPCDLVMDESDGAFYLMEPLASSLVEGSSYTVNWNGTDWTVTCKTLQEDGVVLKYLGNGDGTTEEPFLFAEIPAGFGGGEVFGMCFAMDGATAVRISITGEIVRKIDSKYLPQTSGSGYVIKIDDSVDLSKGSAEVPNSRDDFAQYLWNGGNVLIDFGGSQIRSLAVPVMWVWNGSSSEQNLRAVVYDGVSKFVTLIFRNGTWTPPAA